MRFIRFRRIAAVLVAGVLGAVALLVGPATTASAGIGTTRAGSLGEVDSWITGMPSYVHRGETVTFTVWFRVRTHRTFAPYQFGTDMGSAGPAGGAQYRGISMSFYDRATHRWESPMSSRFSADFRYRVGGVFEALRWPAGSLQHVSFRVHFGYSTYLGHWWIDGGAEGFLPPSYDQPDASMKVTRFTVVR